MRALRCGEYVYNLLADRAAIEVGLAAVAERNHTIGHSVEGVIVTHLYVLTCLNLSTALAHDNHAWASCLAMRELNA